MVQMEPQILVAVAVLRRQLLLHLALVLALVVTVEVDMWR